MNEKTNQMSLLDALGFAASEEPGSPDIPETGKAEKAEKPAKKPRRKAVAGTKTGADAVQEAAGSADAPPRADTLPAPSGAAPPAALPQPPEDPLPLDRFLCFALYSANHAMHGVYKPLLKEIGLTYPQYLTMTVLWETNNVPVGTITSKLQLDTNTLTPLLKRLETMDLVTRTRNPKDERQVILKLTRKGRALQKKTAHFSACILKGAGVEANDLLDLQSRIMTLRDNLRRSGAENG